MKKIVVFVLMLFVIQGCATIDQFNVDANKSKRFPPSQEMKVGVLTFNAPAPGVSKYSTLGAEGTYTTPANVGVSVADAVSPELMNIPNIILIERSQLEKILHEHKLSLSGIVNNPDFKLLGKILPVDALLIGNVTNFTYWHEALNWGASVAYSARLVNIHTGEVLFTINCSAQKHNGIADKMSQELAKEAIRKAFEK